MPEEPPKSWLRQFADSTDPKWAAALIVSLLGGGALVHNNAQIGEETEGRHHLRQKVDSLATVVRRQEVAIYELKRGRRVRGDPVDLRVGNAPPNPVKRFFSLLFSPFRVGPKDLPKEK